MDVLEIILLICGGIIFVLSFIVPDRKEKNDVIDKELTKQELKKLVIGEIDNVREHVRDVVDEAVEYSMEKTERTLERLSNEKIMAVNEYSDTVLQEIHKNHEEVMFLYDMLNDKHTNLKNTVSEANKTVKEVTESRKEAEAVVNSFQNFSSLSPQNVSDEEKVIEKITTTKNTATKRTSNKTTQQNNTQKKVDNIKPGSISITDIDYPNIELPENNNVEEGINNNDKILELYKQGKSNVAIAKELGLGVGEVKLVIDLYKNMQ